MRFGLGEEIESEKATDAAVQDACLVAAAWSDVQNAAGKVDNPLDFDVGFRGIPDYDRRPPQAAP